MMKGLFVVRCSLFVLCALGALAVNPLPGVETRDPEAASFAVRAGDSGGSGTAIGRGLLVTNVHVVRDSWEHVEARHRDYPDLVWVGRTVLQMPDADLALVAFSAQPELPYVPLAESAVGTGDKVTLCGYGRTRQLRRGSGLIASDSGRREGTRVTVLEPRIDGEPGDSGGGLFNDAGELVGVNWGGNGDGGAATPVYWVAKLASDAVDRGLVENYQCGDGACFRGGMSGGSSRLAPMVPVERPRGPLQPAPTLDPEPPTAEEADARPVPTPPVAPKPTPAPAPVYVTPDQLFKSQADQDAALGGKLDALGKQIEGVSAAIETLRSDGAKADAELGGLVGQLTEKVADNDQQLAAADAEQGQRFTEISERIKSFVTFEGAHQVATDVTKKAIEATGKTATESAAANWLGLPITGLVLGVLGISGPPALATLAVGWLMVRALKRQRSEPGGDGGAAARPFGGDDRRPT